MNLRSLDLNLLVILDALLSERSVTRAGRRLGLSQPATSAALNRLRAHFGDRLLERSRDEMLITEKASRLLQPLGTALEAVSAAITTDHPFDPAAISRLFKLTMADGPAFLLMPDLCHAVEEASPMSRVELKQLDREQLLHSLLDDDVDLAITLGIEPNKNLESEIIFHDEVVCIARRGHPIFRIKRNLWHSLATYPWVDVSYSQRVLRLAEFASQQSCEIRIAAVVPHFLLVPPFVERTDFIGIIGRRAAAHYSKKFDIAVIPMRRSLLRVSYRMIWHRRTSKSEAHAWFRDRIREVVV